MGAVNELRDHTSLNSFISPLSPLLPSLSSSSSSPSLYPTEKNFEVAIDYYSQAIELNPFIAVFYGNRSFAYLKTESYGYALKDASKALELDSKYIKVSPARCFNPLAAAHHVWLNIAVL